jgi:hypothetical protein
MEPGAFAENSALPSKLDLEIFQTAKLTCPQHATFKNCSKLYDFRHLFSLLSVFLDYFTPSNVMNYSKGRMDFSCRHLCWLPKAFSSWGLLSFLC